MARRRSGAGASKARRRQPPSASFAPSSRPVAPAATPVGPGQQVSEAAEPEALVVTYSFDADDAVEPYDATVRLTGRRVGIRGLPRKGDSFAQDETVEGIIPGTGPVSITAWVYGLQPGDWEVDARLMPTARGTGLPKAMTSDRPAIQRATWSWRRWALSTAPPGTIRTRWALMAPLARQPAVIPGVYTALAIVGFTAALVLQATIVTREGMSFGPPLAASLIAIGLGLIGAKVWYKLLHPADPWLQGGGWAVDGFVVVFPLGLALMLTAWELPIGRIFDATAPGIFLAVAIGRVGCFLTGCCAGRCTSARWGIWSSDRRVGARRIPAQLLESAVGLALTLATLPLALAGGLVAPGVLFILAFAIYAAFRQVLLRLRAERRRDARTLPLTAAGAGLVALVVAALALGQGT